MEVLGVCPKCGGQLSENDRAYGCENWPTDKGGCDYKVWKTVGGRAITPEEATVILTGGTTEMLDGFIVTKEGPRKGQTFQAQLKMSADGSKVDMIFPPRK